MTRKLPKLPVVQKVKVYHVGKEPSAKPKRRRFSLEGPGLSVSEHPQEWSRIARLGGVVWELQRVRGDGVFVDVHGITKKQKATILNRAVETGWITPATLWRFTYYDDEADEERFFTFATREEAADESEGWGYAAEEGVTEITGHKPAQQLLWHWAQFFSDPFDLGMTEEVVLMAFIEAIGLYDGLWWREKLDPSLLSAPRGVIFQSKLMDWCWKAVGKL
jgi:hypothetical protein